MRRHLIGFSNIALQCSTKISIRSYYDKVRQDREKSDVSPSEMFDEFPRNPSPNRVPESLHTVDNDAVDAAEKMQRWFLMGIIVLVPAFALTHFMDPFSEGYKRPEGYGCHPVGKEMEAAVRRY